MYFGDDRLRLGGAVRRRIQDEGQRLGVDIRRVRDSQAEQGGEQRRPSASSHRAPPMPSGRCFRFRPPITFH